MTDLRGQLQAIYDKHGQLTPKLVVKAAAPTKHPLHNHFEWNDEIAGEQYRLIQAQELIRSCRVAYTKPDGTKEQIRYWHPVRADAPYVYDPLDKIVADPISAEVLLRDMERDWNSLKRRYETFAEFWQLVRKDSAA